MKNRRGWLLALACLACQPSLRPDKVAKPKLAPAAPGALREFRAGVRALDGGQAGWKSAEKHFLQATAADEKLWEAWHNLGILYLRRDEPERAANMFKQSLAINPASPKTLLANAEAHRLLGKRTEARRDYAQTIVQRSDDPVAYVRLASLLRESEDYGAAEETLQRALAAVGATPDIYVEMGLVYLAKGRSELAELVLRKALALDDKKATIWNGLAQIMLARGDDQLAFEYFYRAIALEPGFMSAHFNIALVLLDSGDYARARTELAEVVKADPEDFSAQVLLGVAARGAGDFEAARRTWVNVVERTAASSQVRGDALFNLAILALDFKRDEKAATLALDRYLAEAPPDHEKRALATERRKELVP